MTETTTENKEIQRVPRRILSSLISAVSAGVVPRIGAPYIAIGRQEEIKALLSDMETVDEGGCGMRFLIGRYGSGKSFLMQLVRGYALERDFITADADLTPERRLYGSDHAGLFTYRELMKNLASKSSPDGGALPVILTKWLDKVRMMSDGREDAMEKEVRRTLSSMENLVGGFDFSKILLTFFRAQLSDEDEAQDRKSAALKWFRGEYTSKAEARAALGFPVSVIVDDDNWYDFLKLWAALCREIGYRGLIVFIDECVNLYKITNRISRENNYEKILSMFNDTLQGRAPGMEIILGGTPQFLEDTRRGLFSYEALRSRLCDSRFSVEGTTNMMGPLIRLRRLSDNEMLALIVRLTKLYGQFYGEAVRVSEDDMKQFLKICMDRTGADSMITPREMLRDYMTVLNLLHQNPELDFGSIVGKAVTMEPADGSADAVPKEESAPRTQKTFTPDDISF